MPPSIQRLTIGRDPSCTIPIAHDSISRRHAVLALVGQEISLEDTGSSNGTFLIRGGKKQRISKAMLTREDRVQFGEVELSIGDLVSEYWREEDAPAQEEQRPLERSSAEGKGKLIRCACGLVRIDREKCAGCGQ